MIEQPYDRTYYKLSKVELRRKFAGIIAFISWIFWNVLVYSSPDKHPWISEDELAYIAVTTGHKKRNKVGLIYVSVERLNTRKLSN